MTSLTAGELGSQVLADLLFNICYIEGWNTGIRRMRDEMRRHGLPEPTFTEVGETFKVTFQGPGDRILDLIPEAGITNLRAVGLIERKVKALAIMLNEGRELTIRECRQMFDITYVTAFRDLAELVNTDQATLIGSGRSRRYVA